jgi:hypothetical protein
VSPVVLISQVTGVFGRVPPIELDIRDLGLCLKKSGKMILQEVTVKLRPGRVTAVMVRILAHLEQASRIVRVSKVVTFVGRHPSPVSESGRQASVGNSVYRQELWPKGLQLRFDFGNGC